jgi:hypothetical protein
MMVENHSTAGMNNSDCVNDALREENLDCTLDQLPDLNDFLAKLKADQIPIQLPCDEIDPDNRTMMVENHSTATDFDMSCRIIPRMPTSDKRIDNDCDVTPFGERLHKWNFTEIMDEITKKELMKNSILHTEDIFSKNMVDGPENEPKIEEEKASKVFKTEIDIMVEACTEWALDHIEHPYPSRIEKERLSTRAGVSFVQVSNWFSNWRIRHWRNVAEKLGIFVKSRFLRSPQTIQQKKNLDNILTYHCEAWLNNSNNMKNPYPSTDVKKGVSQITGKSEKSVNDWFVNWRKRKWIGRTGHRTLRGNK